MYVQRNLSGQIICVYQQRQPQGWLSDGSPDMSTDLTNGEYLPDDDAEIVSFLTTPSELRP